MIIRYIAQSGFLLTFNDGKVAAIDVWLQNPLNPTTIDQIPKTNYVFITHDHFDHDLKTGIALAKRDGSTFISGREIAEYAKSQGVQNAVGGDIGQTLEVSGMKVNIVRADHSSDTGIPVGFVIETSESTIYHMGDTAYIPEFKDIGQRFEIDLLFVPIGSMYTMGPQEAVEAVRDVHPRVVIPMHYNTFEQIKQDSTVFGRMVKSANAEVEVKVVAPGVQISL